MRPDGGVSRDRIRRSRSPWPASRRRPVAVSVRCWSAIRTSRRRRRHRARRPVRPPPARLRGLHGLRPLTRVHRGRHPRRGAAALRQHAHGGLGDRAPDDAAARGRAPDRPPGRRRRRGRRGRLLRARARRGPSTGSIRVLELDRFAAERPVVFVGPYEHHSNELPWRESTADVVVIGEDGEGGSTSTTCARSSSATPRGRSRSAASRRRRTSPASSRTSTPSRSSSTATARWRSGTMRPPAPTSRSR